jgi:hypothetical protein
VKSKYDASETQKRSGPSSPPSTLDTALQVGTMKPPMRVSKEISRREPRLLRRVERAPLLRRRTGC